MIKEGQIVFANLHFKNKKGKYIIVNKVIISRDYNKPLKTTYTLKDDESKLKSYDIKEDVTLINIDIIENLGYKNK